MMIILLTVIAVVITGVPLTAVALVTLASRREETARSIAGRAPGPLERAARRLLAFHATGIGHHPSARAHRRTEDAGPPVGGDILAGRGVDSGLVLTEDGDLMLGAGAEP